VKVVRSLLAGVSWNFLKQNSTTEGERKIAQGRRPFIVLLPVHVSVNITHFKTCKRLNVTLTWTEFVDRLWGASSPCKHDHQFPYIIDKQGISQIVFL